MKRYCLDARTNTSHFPGIGRYVRSLVTAITPQLQADETLVILQSEQDPTDFKDARTEIVKTAVTPFEIRQQWALRRLLTRLRLDVYHSPYYLMPYFLPIPVVLTVHDFIPQFFPEYVSTRARRLFHLSMWLAARSATQMISVSEATRQDFLRLYRFPADRVGTIHHGAYQPDSTQAASALAVREKYGLPDAYVLYLGINKPHKNLLSLVEAWQQVTRQVESHQLVIAGAWDPRFPEPKEIAHTLGLDAQLKFVGPIDEADLAAVYRGADIFVFPSKYEGFGFPILEAMACGTPVACSNLSCMPEVAGDAAAFFDPYQPGEIAASLVDLIIHPAKRSQYAQSGIERAAHFSWQSCAASVLEIYRRIAYN